MLAFALAVLSGASCARSAVYQPFDTSLINRQDLLMLDAANQAPLPEAIGVEALNRIEDGLKASPYVGKVVTRADFRERFRSEFTLRSDYTLVSDTMATVGMTEWSHVLNLGRGTASAMLLSFQVFFTPCPGCDEGDKVAAVGQMVHSATGALVWRTTIVKPVGSRDGAVAVGIREVSESLVETFNQSLKPKWHRERFRNLSASAGQPPEPIRRQDLERGLRIRTGGGQITTDAP